MNPYANEELGRADVDAIPGVVVLEFGANWCGHCQAASPLVAAALAPYSGVRHIRVEDGPGRPLGRSYRIKLWPTLVFLKDGQEIERLVRPTNAEAITLALAGLAPDRT
ncbi:thioredoxin family protein [Propionivibrio limicola]|uniref:thioredoxin family protein n=1 Tax=Propionivibrio limicola TaxID=167645 RepID=UPI00129164AC|nr:thioredoxin family protein [Propionivibrio limicola]